jgi:hypothetical protein
MQLNCELFLGHLLELRKTLSNRTYKVYEIKINLSKCNRTSTIFLVGEDA